MDKYYEYQNENGEGGGYDRIKLYIITRVNSKSMANMTEKLKTKYMMWSQEDVEKDITGSYGYSW